MLKRERQILVEIFKNGRELGFAPSVVKVLPKISQHSLYAVKKKVIFFQKGIFKNSVNILSGKK
jgi:hypothetical protein